MGKFKSDSSKSIIICHAEISSRRKELSLKMALDTGATYTIISIEAAMAIGCDPAHAQSKTEITTGSGVEYVPIVTIPKFRALGIEVKNIPVACHNLPPVESCRGPSWPGFK